MISGICRIDLRMGVGGVFLCGFQGQFAASIPAWFKSYQAGQMSIVSIRARAKWA